jgi:hypothetical protein
VSLVVRFVLGSKTSTTLVVAPLTSKPPVISCRPSAIVTTEGYQRPTAMLASFWYVSVTKSNTYTVLVPLQGFRPSVPPTTSALPSGSNTCPAQKRSSGVRTALNVPVFVL